MKQFITSTTAGIALIACLGAGTLFADPQSGDKPDAVPASTPSIPNVEVLDQDGNTVRFYDDLIKDRIVAINFVFSTCPTICPLMEVNFRQLQKTLKQTPETQDVQLISVTVDPATDTPARLKVWSQQFDAEDGWAFITGKKNTIDNLLKKFEVFTADKTDHPSFILIGDDASGEWKRVSSLASAKILAKEIGRLPLKDKPEEAGKE